jgi:predicted RNA-binding Zn-ribbon protein involved in translation (DUF1610 family)
MKCKSCNADIQNNDSYCPYCGVEVAKQNSLSFAGGVNRCPMCGSPQLTFNPKIGKLQCNHCQHEFEMETVEHGDITKLQGTVVDVGAQNIIADTSDIITFRCDSCGAEVVIDTREAVHARCHWCRSILTIKQQIPNGAVPDMILPFKLSKESAQVSINNFVKKRQFYANPKFKAEFCTENIMGVYLPYMIVDINAHAKLYGQGEILVRKYKVSDNDTRYDADLYYVEREFDLLVDDLSIEASAEKRQFNTEDKTNNIINAVMPFDTENAVKWNGNYLLGYASERRDSNMENLSDVAVNQIKEICRYRTDETVIEYNRGMHWDGRKIDIKGNLWKSAYLPIWLYSYQENKGNKKTLHYVAVNARTGETMGSVPINTTRLFFVSLIIEIIAGFFGINVFKFLAEQESDLAILPLFLLTVGFIYYGYYYKKYRNFDAKHNHETDTRSTIMNVRKVDAYSTRRRGLSSTRISGYNNMDTKGISVTFQKTVDSNSNENTEAKKSNHR